MIKGGNIVAKAIKGGFYQHHKGSIYEVLDIAKHTESLEELVIYRRGELGSPDTIWARPRAMFEETFEVEHQGKKVKADRFLYLGGGSKLEKDS